MEIILWIVFGALVGWMASRITKSFAQESVLLNIGIGSVGAVIGGWIMKLIGEKGIGNINLYSFLVALIGAIILIYFIRGIRYLTKKYVEKVKNTI